jgi:hypothetical protein
MRSLRVMSVRHNAEGNYKQSIFRGFYSIFMSLGKSMNIKEIWIVVNGGSFSKTYDDNIDVYNAFSFSDGNEVIERLNPDLVIVPADYEYLSRSILKAASHAGIPTVNVLSSLFESTTLDYSYDKEKIIGRLQALWTHGRSIIRKYAFLLKTLLHARYGLCYIIRTIMMDAYLPFISWEPRYRFGGGDLNIVSTPMFVDLLVKNGIDRSKIVVTGDVGMDTIYDKLIRLPRKTIRNNDKVEILFITDAMVEHGYWTPSMHKEIITTVVRAISEQLRNEANLRLKIHPISERLDIYRQLVDPIDPSIEIIQHADLLPLINDSDVIVTFGVSSALFEVLLLEKPMYLMNIFDEDTTKNIFLKEKVATECKTMEELISKIRNRIYYRVDSERVYALVEKYMYKFDGKCSERAANHIISLVNTHPESGLFSKTNQS